MIGFGFGFEKCCCDCCENCDGEDRGDGDGYSPPFLRRCGTALVNEILFSNVEAIGTHTSAYSSNSTHHHPSKLHTLAVSASKKKTKSSPTLPIEIIQRKRILNSLKKQKGSCSDIIATTQNPTSKFPNPSQLTSSQ